MKSLLRPARVGASLLAVNAALLGLLCYAWLAPAAPSRVAVLHVRSAAASGLPSLSAAGMKVAQNVDIILARPLFSASRRPPPQHSAGVVAASQLPRLSGIMIGGGVRKAIFEGSGKPLVGSVGDHVGAFKIVAIAPADISVDGPDGLERVFPGFDANRRETLSEVARGSLLGHFRPRGAPRIAVPHPPRIGDMLAGLPKW